MFSRRSILIGSLSAVVLPVIPVRAQTRSPIEDVCEASPPLEQGSPSRICTAVNDQLEETRPELAFMGFNYRTRIYLNARADPLRDPPSHIAKKVQHFWARYSDQLVCSLLGFSIRPGSLLKLAVARDSSDFINDVTRRWQLWLNGRDITGETVLDFVESETVRSRGTPNENIMRRYSNLLRRYGAKRAAELTPQDQPIDPARVELEPLRRTWDRACYLSEGLAAVKRGSRWGYADAAGNAVVAPKYDGAFAFSSGRAAVHLAGRWGYIDNSGREIISLQYRDARVFKANGTADVTVDGSVWRPIGLDG